jgi:hypothetical protein
MAMPENQQNPLSSEVTPSGAIAGAAVDPLRSLHKMSTTAGVGSQEYVAINVAAVWAIVLGLASAMTVLSNALLVIPVIGIIFGIVALKQIAGSSGTQTGRGIAIVGLILCVGFAGVSLAGQWMETAGDREDKEKVAALVEQLGRDIKAGNMDAAYGRFSEEFRKGVKKEQFVTQATFLRSSSMYGNLESMTWNGRVNFNGPPKGELRFAESVLLIYMDTSKDPIRQNIALRRTGGQWYIDRIADMFAPPAPTGGGGSGGGAAG